MAEARVERRLAAILAADVAGYSRLMGVDEEGTLAALKACRRELIDPKIAEHRGRIVKTTGDGALVEFASAVDAVRCAMEIQRAMVERNASIPEDRRVEFRIGINVGDIIIDEGDIYGDGVNIAARLEGIAKSGGISISEDAWRQVQGKVAANFVDIGEQNLKNIATPVPVYCIELAEGSATQPAPPALALRDKPSIAVLPFTNMSGDAEQEFFADGLTEDLITALSYWRSFSVIARNSTFAYKGKSPDIREVARHLGVRYVLEGSIRRAGDRVRITAQLIDGASGNHVWAERYDRRVESFFDLQDEITRTIAAKIEPEFAKAEQKRVAQKPSANLDAWECYQRGLASLNELTSEGNLRAREYFARAIEIEPTNSRAHSALAYCIFRYSYDGYSDEKGLASKDAIALAQRAIALDDGDDQAHEMLAILLLQSAGDLDAAIAEVRRAVEINPNNAHAYLPLGNSQSFAGRPKEGIPHLETAIRLNPNDSRGHIYLSILAEAYLNNREYAQAVVCARRCIDRKRDFPHPYCTLASALGHVGETEAAATALEQCLRLSPNFIANHPQLEWYRNPFDKAHILDGLRKAGWGG